MRDVPTMAAVWRATGRAGEATNSWAQRRFLARRRRVLRSLGIFDSVPFGRIRGAGALSRLGQLRVGWWHDLVAEARRDEATAVVVQVGNITWLLARLDEAQGATDDGPAPQGDCT